MADDTMGKKAIKRWAGRLGKKQILRSGWIADWIRENPQSRDREIADSLSISLNSAIYHRMKLFGSRRPTGPRTKPGWRRASGHAAVRPAEGEPGRHGYAKSEGRRVIRNDPGLAFTYAEWTRIHGFEAARDPSSRRELMCAARNGDAKAARRLLMEFKFRYVPLNEPGNGNGAVAGAGMGKKSEFIGPFPKKAR